MNFTPYFLLDEVKFKNNIEQIEFVKKEAGVDIILALKGFAMWSTFPMIKEKISSAAASSLNEILLCNEFLGSKAHTYCVAYADNEFSEIIKRSSHITFNSIAQYDKYIDLIPEDILVGIRVNPGYSDVNTEIYNPSSLNSRLGIYDLKLKSLPPKVSGLHFHVLCESNAQALERVLANFERKFATLLSQIQWINMGGGHLITHTDYDISRLIRTLRAFKEKYNVQIILEPGAAFVWQAGTLHTRVMDIVKNGGEKTAIINASFTCHMPDCLEMPYRPEIANAMKIHMKDKHPYKIGGISCLAGDFLEEYWFDKPLSVGDEIVFQDMIHYTMVKTNFFNGIKHPSIVIKKTNGELKFIKSFTYEDYKHRLS